MDLNLKGVGEAPWRSDLSDADVFTTATAMLAATIFQTTSDAIARPALDALARFGAS
jgi:hypothetical protein